MTFLGWKKFPLNENGFNVSLISKFSPSFSLVAFFGGAVNDSHFGLAKVGKPTGSHLACPKPTVVVVVLYCW